MINEKMIKIKKQLEEGVSQVFEKDKYKEYLDCMSKFHKYSFRNVLLINMQMPEATNVAGIVKWQNDFGRKIKNEEKNKGITILQPCVYSRVIERIKKDSQGEVRLNKDGKIELSLSEVTVPHFQAVTVFDVKQTEGKKLNLKKIEIGDDIRHLDIIKKMILKNGFEQISFDRKTKEFELESIQYVVCNYFGLDTSKYNFGNVDLWGKSKELIKLSESLDSIQKKSNHVIDAIEQILIKGRRAENGYTFNL